MAQENSSSELETVTPSNHSMVDVTAQNKRQEYGTQFFGMTPKSVIGTIYNCLMQYLVDGMESLEKLIINDFQSKHPEKYTEEEIKQGSNKILKSCEETIDKAFDKLENYIQLNIFKIPDDIVLPEDKAQTEHHYSKEQVQRLERELAEMRHKIHALKYTNAWLKQGIKDGEKIEGQHRAFLSQLETLEKTCIEAGIKDLGVALGETNERKENIHKKLLNLQKQCLEPLREETAINQYQQKNKKIKLT